MTLWSSVMTDEITYATRTGYDDNGDPTYGTKSTLKARYEESQSVFTQTIGRQEDVRDVIITHTAVSKEMVFWLPADDSDNDPGREPAEINISTTLDGSSTLYEVVL